MSAALSLDGIGLSLRPHFWSRQKLLLNNISFAVERGEMCALLGANGAGKTTLLRIVLGLLTATSGQGSLLGHPLGVAAGRAGVGFLPERPCLPPTLTALEAVCLSAELMGIERRQVRLKATEALARLHMAHCLHGRLRTFSKGMLQRVGLAQAIVGEPKLLVLDEPLSGLDPPARRDVRLLLAEERARGAAILFATHILADVVASCDRAAVLVAGELRHHASPATLLAEVAATRKGGTAEVVVELCVSALDETKLNAPEGSILHVGHFGNELRLRVAGLAAANAVVDAVRAAGGQVLSLEQDARALEALLIQRPPSAIEATPC